MIPLGICSVKTNPKFMSWTHCHSEPVQPISRESTHKKFHHRKVLPGSRDISRGLPELWIPSQPLHIHFHPFPFHHSVPCHKHSVPTWAPTSDTWEIRSRMDAILTDLSTELTWTMLVRVTLLLIYSPVCSLSIGLIGHDSIKDYKSSSLESVLYLTHFSPLLHECSFESSIQHRWKEDIP